MTELSLAVMLGLSFACRFRCRLFCSRVTFHCHLLAKNIILHVLDMRFLRDCSLIMD